MANSIQGLEKKQRLLLEYYHAIDSLVKEKSAISAKIKKANERFAQLLETEADSAQIPLFENIDEFLAEVAA